MSRNSIVRWLSVMVIGSVVYLWIQRMADRTAIPRQIKIADVTQTNIPAAFYCPKAEVFSLLLAVSNEAPRFKVGSIHFGNTNGMQKFDFEFGDMQPCNWLDKYGLAGHILTWGNISNRIRLEKYFKPHETNHVTVSFDQLPAQNASLWISYIQSGKEARLERKRK